MPSEYAYRVEDAVAALIQNPSIGFYTVAKQLAAPRDIEIPAFDLADGEGYFYRVGLATWTQYLNFGEPQFPAFFLHVTQTVDLHLVKFQDFSGTISTEIDVLLSTDGTDFTSLAYLNQLANVFQDAFYNVFSIPNCRSLSEAGLLFNGGIRVTRQKPFESGENLLLPMTAALPFAITS